jgi:acetylornithine deacetylase
VGAGGMADAFTPVVKDGRVYGRGAYDMKGSLAAIMITAREAAKLGLGGDLIIAAVADEEVASLGTAAVLQRREADAAIVTEPTELRLCLAHKGFAWLEVETEGLAAHGSRADIGVDAIAAMGRILTGITNLDRRLRNGRGHPLLGRGSVHASLISGGQELSTYPAACLVKIERRTIPGESRPAPGCVGPPYARANPLTARRRQLRHRSGGERCDGVPRAETRGHRRGLLDGHGADQCSRDPHRRIRSFGRG